MAPDMEEGEGTGRSGASVEPTATTAAILTDTAWAPERPRVRNSFIL